MEKVAIIGCGAIASTHVHAVLFNNRTIVGLCDIVEERAIKLKNDFNLKSMVFTNYITMLNELDIDVVHICTPHFLHKEMIIEALKRNINVLCEKPLCISLDEINEIRTQIERSSAQLGVCYQNRYNDTTIKAKEICEKIKFNKGKIALKWKRDGNYYSNSTWRGKWDTEGGSLLINQSIHSIDLMCHLLGNPNELSAMCENIKHKDIIETEDTATIYFFGDNISFEFFGTTNADKDYPVLIELYNDNNKLILEPNSITFNKLILEPNSITFNGQSDVHLMDEINFAKSVWGDGHKKLVKDFYECIESSKPFSIGLDEAVISLKAVLAAYRSNGNKIKI
jgi:predicted dehydrogenase